MSAHPAARHGDKMGAPEGSSLARTEPFDMDPRARSHRRLHLVLCLDAADSPCVAPNSSASAAYCLKYLQEIESVILWAATDTKLGLKHR